MTHIRYDLAVIIVNWNTCEVTVEALRSLYADLSTSGLEALVMVVDNGSSDASVDVIAAQFPQVRLIASSENLGFVGANNLAMRGLGFGSEAQTEVPPEYTPESLTELLPRAVYLLNSDTITQPGATRTLFDALFSAPDVGLVGAQLSYGDGSFQHGAFKFPGLRQLWVEFFPTPGRLMESGFNGRYPRAAYVHGQPFDVDFTLGATMMLRREVIQQTGMFDERFFMYCEEIDWAWRIKAAGWRVLSVPMAHVTHLGGQSTSQARPQSTLHLWTSRLKLFRKVYPAWKRFLARQMVILGMARKIQQAEHETAWTPDERQRMIETYREIQRLARL
ncbi:MAG: glycosyltransferase family 2 protein [Anaerolineae bacterium]